VGRGHGLANPPEFPTRSLSDYPWPEKTAKTTRQGCILRGFAGSGSGRIADKCHASWLTYETLEIKISIVE